MAKIEAFNSANQIIDEQLKQDALKFKLEEKEETICKLNKKILLNDMNDKRTRKAKEEKIRIDFMNEIRKRLRIKKDEPFGYNPDTGEII